MSDVLTEQERQAVQDLLGTPLDFPAKFKSWFIDYMSQNLPPLPVDHLEGYVKTRGYGADATPGVITNGVGWVGGRGPTFSGLSPGTYLMLWGFAVPVGVIGGVSVRMGPILDGGGSPSDNNACKVTVGSVGAAGSRARVINLQSSADFEYKSDVWGGTPVSPTIPESWATLVRLA